MRKALFIFGLALSILGCKGGSSRLGPEFGDLSEGDYARLQRLNRMHEDNRAAVQLAFQGVVPAAASEKVNELAKMIADACVSQGSIPDDQMGGTPNTHEVMGPNCPLYWYRARSYNSVNNTFTYHDNFEVRHNEYLKLGEMRARRFSGHFQATRPGLEKRISGTINIAEFITPFGRVSGSIRTDQTYPTGDRGGGNVALYLRGPDWEASATVTWEIPNFEPRFYVNGNEIERKVFEDLFSSYELIKIMENSLKMR